MAYRVTMAVVFAAAGVALSLILGRYTSQAPTGAPVRLPDAPPPGWTVECGPNALGLVVCQTYPPGDRRWEPTQPPPPWRPYVLPSGPGNGRSLAITPSPRP